MLKMDHYCVWVLNTVGLLNYKHFVLFMSYAWLACFFRCVGGEGRLLIVCMYVEG